MIQRLLEYKDSAYLMTKCKVELPNKIYSNKTKMIHNIRKILKN